LKQGKGKKKCRPSEYKKVKVKGSKSQQKKKPMRTKKLKPRLQGKDKRGGGGQHIRIPQGARIYGNAMGTAKGRGGKKGRGHRGEAFTLSGFFQIEKKIHYKRSENWGKKGRWNSNFMTSNFKNERRRKNNETPFSNVPGRGRTRGKGYEGT